MNKFSDGFSDNSYEELLNQYAGESLGSKSKNSGEDIKVSSFENETSDMPAYEDPVFNIDTKKKSKPVIEKAFDIDLVTSFEEPVKKPQPVIEKKYESPSDVRKTTPNKNSNTMEFNTTKTNRGKAAVSSAKNFVADKFKKFDSKISSDYAPEKESVPTPKVLIKRNGKIKIDFKALKYLVLKSYKENKQMYIGFGCCLLVSIILASYKLFFSFSLLLGNLIHVNNNIAGGINAYIPYKLTVKYPTTKVSTKASLLHALTLFAIVTRTNIAPKIIKFILNDSNIDFIFYIM